jgi:hypothetical protein
MHKPQKKIENFGRELKYHKNDIACFFKKKQIEKI